MEKGCKICYAPTQELDAQGRCGSCAAAFEAAKGKLTYGKFMALKSRPAPVKPIEIEELPSENPDGREYTCGSCGKVFYKSGARGMYCSEECRKTAHREMAKERYRGKHNLAPRLCLHCGKPIAEDVHWLAKTCSKECQEAHRKWHKKQYAARYRAMKREEAQHG